jgi:hypothetical protein
MYQPAFKWFFCKRLIGTHKSVLVLSEGVQFEVDRRATLSDENSAARIDCQFAWHCGAAPLQKRVEAKAEEGAEGTRQNNAMGCLPR